MPELRVPGVPYQAYPTVTPQGQLPGLSVRTDPNMFGANVAGAVEHLGGTLEHVGDELFTRAISLQKDKIETEVNAAAKGALTDGEMLAEQFKLKLGTEANDEALHKYNTDLNNMMQQRRDSLSSPYAKRLFDRETLTPFRQFTVAGGSHAAHEQNASSIHEAEALLAAKARLVNQNPDSQTLVDSIHKDTDSAIDNLAIKKGWTQAEKENYKFDYNSHLYHQQIDGLSRDKPGDAMAALQKVKDQKLLNNKDYLSVLGTVSTRLRHAGAQSASDAVNTHPEGISYPPGWSRRDIEYAEGALEPLNRVVRQLGLDEPGLRVKPAIGFGPTLVRGGDLDVKVTGDLDEGVAKSLPAAKKAGIKIEARAAVNHIHLR